MTRSVIAFLLLLLNSASASAQDIQFVTKFSEPFAVFQFINSLSNKNHDNVYKRLFSHSSFATKKYTDLISQYSSLNLTYEYDFTDYPAGQKVGIDVPNLLRRNLIICDSLPDFRLHSTGLVPNEKLMQLIYLIKEFTRVYEAVIYEPSKSKFEEQLHGIRNLIQTSNINYYFTEAMQFYN